MTTRVGQSMQVSVVYFEGCPNWTAAEDHVREALDRLGRDDVHIERLVIESDEHAGRLAFRGSPTVLIDGIDPFADPSAAVGLSCRMYRTPDGLAGAPTVGMLLAAVKRIAGT